MIRFFTNAPFFTVPCKGRNHGLIIVDVLQAFAKNMVGFPNSLTNLLVERIKEGLHFGQLVIGVKAIYNLDEDIFVILKHIPCH